MTIENVTQTQLPYVDGVPSVGQSRIDWIQNGEYLDAAISATDNGGALNRGAVKVQQNVDKVNAELNLTKDALNETIDLVNVHDQILNASGDGTNLYDRVGDLESKNILIDNKLNQLDNKDIVHDNAILNINNNITTNINPQITNIKSMLGNYKGFDVDGNPDVNSLGRGVKGQVERNMENIVAHNNRLNTLESWWDGNTPDVLMQNVDDLREEIGSRSNKKPLPIYTRLNSIEDHVTSTIINLNRIDNEIGTTNFPKNYTKHDGSIISVNNISEFVNAIDIDLKHVENDLNQISDTLDDTVIDVIGLKQTEVTTINRVGNLENIVGLSPVDGIRGELKTLDLREANNADRFNGLIGNLTDVVNLELKPQVNTLQSDMNNIKPIVLGTGNIADPDLVRLGVKATNEQMYNDMYVPFISGSGFILDSIEQRVDTNYVRRYVNSEWQWVADDTYDVVIGNGKVLRNLSGVHAVSYELNNTVFGSHGNNISIRGVISEPLNFTTTNIKFGVDDVIKFNDLMEIGKNKLQFNVTTKDDITVSYNGEIKKIIHGGNVNEFVNDIDPRSGFVLNEDTSISAYDGITNVNLIKLDSNTDKIIIGDTNNLLIDSPIDKLILGIGSSISATTSDNTANILSISEIGLNKYSVLGDTNASGAIRTVGNDLTTAKIIDNNNITYTIWHDGIDAPNDNAFYARKNGTWTAFNTSGGGGLADDAPDNGLPYLRTSLNGTAYWEALGDRHITLAKTKYVKFNTDIGVLDGLSIANDGTLTIGDVNSLNNTIIGGKLSSMNLSRSINVTSTKLNNDIMPILSIENDSILFGNSIFEGQPYVRTLVGDKKVWHDGIDAPSDDIYYARKNGVWSMVYNGINPNADVNTTGAYLSKDINIGKVETIGSDNIVHIGQSNNYTKLNGDVLSFKLAQPSDGSSTNISGMIDGQEINVIGTKDNIAGTTEIVLGDVTTNLTISAINAKINGFDITTKADDAPSNGKRYSRKDGQWVESYYYGDFSSAPSNPLEGTVFFEFIN